MAKKMIRYTVCSYCDSGHPSYPYGRDESVHCSSCGAEWDPYTIEEEDVPDEPEEDELFEADYGAYEDDEE